jgi:hypothetical protein
MKGLEVANKIDCAVSLPIMVTEALTMSIEKRKKKIAKSNIKTDQYHFGDDLCALFKLSMTIQLENKAKALFFKCKSTTLNL